MGDQKPKRQEREKMKTVKIPVNAKIHTRSQIASPLIEFLLEKEFKELDCVSYWNGFYIFAVLIISITYSCCLLVVPQHDAIKHPQYWYELALTTSFVFPLYAVLGTLQECNIYFGVNSMLTIRTAVNLYSGMALGFSVPYCLCYFIWTHCFGFNHPIPFVVFCAYPMTISFCIILWFEFPCALRNEKIFRNRLQYYMLSNLWVLVIHFQYALLSTIFTALPSNFQWILAIILPMIRYINLQVYKKLTEKYAGKNNKMATIRYNISVGIEYSMFVAIMLSSATEITLFIILGVEFLLNIRLCVNILRLQRKIRTHFLWKESWKGDIQNKIENLVLNELIEVLVPLAYFSTLSIAYFGPNSSILGGIGNSYWGYQKVEDLGKIMTVGLEMFLLDFTSSIVCGVILYTSCNINLFQEFCKIIMQCWTIMTLLITGKLLTVSSMYKMFGS